MSKPIQLGLVGLGKIALDQHAPTLRASGCFEIAATASPGARLDDVPAFDDMEHMLEATPGLEAISICTPPQSRYALARAALRRGLHVMLEKPPGVSVGEIQDLVDCARRGGATLFAAWHSREASGLAPARAWLSGKTIKSARIAWREDTRVWHPGQQWIWRAGGFGVFDPGINALSLISALLDAPLVVHEAALEFPENCEAPIRAQATMTCAGAPVAAAFDFLQVGPQIWDIEVVTDGGVLHLALGGAELYIDGVAVPVPAEREYVRLYTRFANLIAERQSDVDVTPLQLVLDIFMLARRTNTDPFFP